MKTFNLFALFAFSCIFLFGQKIDLYISGNVKLKTILNMREFETIKNAQGQAYYRRGEGYYRNILKFGPLTSSLDVMDSDKIAGPLILPTIPLILDLMSYNGWVKTS
jgi:hypothetical protein